MGTIIYNGKMSSNYGIISEVIPSYEIPERLFSKTHVPGRNGDIMIDLGSWQNVDRTYYLASTSEKETEFVEMATKISKWLNTSKGYAKLSDSYEPNYYRMAIFKGSTVIQNYYQRAARVTATFSCRPERFLVDGDLEYLVPYIFPSGYQLLLKNPTDYESKPIIKIKKKQNDTVGINTYNGTSSSDPLVNFIGLKPDSQSDDFREYVIDTENRTAYYIDTNSGMKYNITDKLVLNYGGDVKLVPNDNYIAAYSAQDNIGMEVRIIPRWWTI